MADQKRRIILITGGARRIGQAISLRLAADGGAVIIHSTEKSAEEARLLAKKITQSGGVAATATADLSDPKQTEKLVEQAERSFGPLNGLVNNAAIFEPDAADDFSSISFDRHMALNLRAPLILAREFFKRLPADQEGAVVNIADQRVLKLNPTYFTYTLAKTALWTATQTMAQAFAPRVRVNAVGPGPVLPNGNEGPEGFAREVAGVPLQRAVDREEIAAAVSYLLSAKNVTGQLIAVDSGQHLGWRTPDLLDA